MKGVKNAIPKKAKPTSTSSTPIKMEYENEIGLLKTVHLLEQDVERLNNINELYKKQIEQLEHDNLALCSKLQQVNAEHQTISNSYILELKRLSLHNQELVRIIHVLEEDMQVKDEQRRQVVIINEDLAQKVKMLEEMRENTDILKADVDRYKIKLLESQKYWLTRTEVLLGNKEAQKQRSLCELDSNCSLKVKLLQQQINFKEKIIDEKTEEIHKLINYIQTKLQ